MLQFNGYSIITGIFCDQLLKYIGFIEIAVGLGLGLGPMIGGSVAGWVVAPIAPHTLSNRPIVLPFECEVSVELVRGLEANVNFDMQSLTSLIKGDRIKVCAAEQGLRLLHPQGWSYFDTLRKKLHWNEGNP